MKKRKNRIAVALWLVAAIFVVAKLVALIVAFQVAGEQMANLTGSSAFNLGFSQALRNAVSTASLIGTGAGILFDSAALVALGAIIELLDKIWLSEFRSTPER